MSHRGSGPVAPAFQASRGLVSGGRTPRRRPRGRLPRYVFGTVIAASLCLSVAQAATFGHSRIVSALGQPLHLEIPVTQLTPQEIDSLRAVPAPAQAWREAGMTPPVALESMRLVLLDGYRPDVKVIQLRSDQVFDQPIVDVLLDVRSVSGQQRYQVSLLAHADPHAIQRAGTDNARNPRVIDGRGAAAAPGSHARVGQQITVHPGDNMFAIARRNAVQGVTVYQMMMALQRSNPQAFIEDNVNLVKAGATLTMPDMDVLTALSDREARRIFQQHAQAFARYRQRSGAADVAMLSTVETAAEGGVSDAAPAVPEADASLVPPGSGDRLRLSGGPGFSPGATGGDAASASALADGAAGSSAAPQRAAVSPDAVGSNGASPAHPEASQGVGRAPDEVARGLGGTGQQGTASVDATRNGVAVTAPGEAAPTNGGRAASTAPQGAATAAADALEASSGPAGAIEAVPQGDASGIAQAQAQAGAGSADTAVRHGNDGVATVSPSTAAAGDRAAAQTEAAQTQAAQTQAAQTQAAQAPAPDAAVSLLASSGAIASDAVADKAPVAVAGDAANGGSKVFGSDAATGGTVLEAGADGRDPDDVAATQKGVQESKKRVLELEDNVRHLNEALQKQGHVAAEAALEGARSVSEAIKEVMSLVDPDDDDEPTAAEEQADAEAAGAVPGTGAGQTGSGAGPTAATPASPASPQAGGGSEAPLDRAAGSAAATPGDFAQQSPSSPSTAAPVRTKKQVSWMQENMLALIGGGLALIVAVVVWLLRRASAARRDAFESDSPITESMLQDRLREIDLDLDAPSSGRTGSRS